MPNVRVTSVHEKKQFFFTHDFSTCSNDDYVITEEEETRVVLETVKRYTDAGYELIHNPAGVDPRYVQRLSLFDKLLSK